MKSCFIPDSSLLTVLTALGATASHLVCVKSARSKHVSQCAYVQGTDDDLSAQQPVSPDQIDIGVKPPGESADGQAGAQHAQTPQEEQKQKKKMAKCCCCVIM